MGERMKKLLPFFLFLLFALNVFTILNVTVTQAYMSGNYYVEDFTHANGYTNYTVSDSGLEWLSVHNVKQTSVYTNTYLISGNNEGICWMNFSSFTTNISLYHTATNGGAYIWSFYQEIYNEANELILTIRNIYHYAGGVSKAYYITSYDGTGSKSQTIINGNGITVIEIVLSNYTIHITDVVFGEFWISGNTHFGYIGGIKIYSDFISGTNCYGTIDDVKRLIATDTTELYDIDTDFTAGDVMLDSDYLTSKSLWGVTDYPCMEQMFYKNTMITIKQFAVAVGDLTENIETTDINLYINGVSYGTFTVYYWYDNRYVLIWQDLDISIGIGDVLFEMIYTSIEKGLEVLTYDDINNDGTSGSRYGYGIRSFGIFDVTPFYGKDIVHKIWYNSTGSWSGLEYTSLCTGYPQEHQPCPYKYLEISCQIKFNAYINAFDLYVYDPYGSYYQNPQRFRLYVNRKTGENYHIPTTITRFNQDFFLMRFDNINKKITNNLVFIELYSMDYYWNIGYSDSTYFIPYFFGHNNANWFGDGGIEGEHKYNYAPTCCLWYTEYFENPNYDDSLAVYPDKDTFLTFERIGISGRISTLAIDSYIKLYHNGVQVNRYGYGGMGKKITSPSYYYSESFVFSSVDDVGSWTVVMQRGGNNISGTFANITVTERGYYDSLDYIWTQPNPSKSNEEFEIGWLYNYAYYGNKGLIQIGTSKDYNVFYTVLTSNIRSNGTMKYRILEDGVYYLFLVVNNNGTYSPVFSYQHIVGEMFLNEIHVSFTQLQLTKGYNDVVSCEQHFYGRHSYTASANVYVADNGNRIKSVSNTPNFDFYFTYYESGTHNISLCVSVDGNVQILDTTYFFISEYTSEGGVELSENNKLLLGFIITLIFLCIPLGLSFKFGIEPNLFIFSFFGTLGMVMSTIFGFFEWFIPTTVITILILILVIIYIGNKFS